MRRARGRDGGRPARRAPSTSADTRPAVASRSLDPDRVRTHHDPERRSGGLTAGLAPALIAAAPGSSLVYLGSGAARNAFPYNAASKHGLAGLADAVHLDLRERGVNVSLVSPGLVAAGSGLASPLGQTHPEELLTPADVAHAVRFVVTFPGAGCPHEMVLEPRRSS